MVLLKRNLREIFSQSSNQFPSHNGSIKTSYDANKIKITSKFPSHNGSIKTTQRFSQYYI
ncbi:hypothetical protein cpu_18180 [Carboxydothermus pertinax]|uniref:Uncharacterized protein n=1 Tax=Carboxydothermus pertinax TaxID=870242 RepID=A0A1L8CWL4_9THEO|nr:hypothetical protein cpu_18180 [Carboxydothermus pertinax]